MPKQLTRINNIERLIREGETFEDVALLKRHIGVLGERARFLDDFGRDVYTDNLAFGSVFGETGCNGAWTTAYVEDVVCWFDVWEEESGV